MKSFRLPSLSRPSIAQNFDVLIGALTIILLMLAGLAISDATGIADLAVVGLPLALAIGVHVGASVLPGRKAFAPDLFTSFDRAILFFESVAIFASIILIGGLALRNTGGEVLMIGLCLWVSLLVYLIVFDSLRVARHLDGHDQPDLYRQARQTWDAIILALFAYAGGFAIFLVLNLVARLALLWIAATFPAELAKPLGTLVSGLIQAPGILAPFIMIAMTARHHLSKV